MDKPNTQLLNEMLNNLDLSRSLKVAGKTNNYLTLLDLTEIKTADLENKPGFNLLLVHEYVRFMETHGLGSWVDTKK